MRNRTSGIGLLVVVSLFVACGKSGESADTGRKAGDTVEREGNPPVHYVADDDPKMQAAIEKARKTIQQFIDANAKPTDKQTGFSVKVAISDGEHVEHMWIGPVVYKDGKFTGELGNEPNDLENVKIGDDISKAKEEISDWMYIDDGKLVGGYSVRLLRAGLSEADRKNFDASVPFSFE